MKRRDFLRYTGTLGVPLLLNKIPANAFSGLDGLTDNTDCLAIRNRVLVLIQMEGGNDGLNTVVPLNQYSLYRTNRPTIYIPDSGANSLINLDTTLPAARQVGIHPAMTAFKDLYDNGKLNVIHGVGYTNNNRSHFKATDHWLTAGDSTPARFDLEAGFMGRYLEYTYPGAVTSPTSWMPDPLALELGANTASIGFKTNLGRYASILLTTDASTFSTSVAGLGGPVINPLPTTQMGNRIQYINSVEQSINAYSTRVTNTYNAGTNLAVYPANSWLSYQLKTVARILKGGSKTKIFLVHVGGYDTHNNQNIAGAMHTGNHANLLRDLADSIKAFQTDLQLLGIEDRVMTATFTEFGRTVDENGNRGTDHGGVNTMFVIGKGVQPGTTGDPINLSLVDDRALIDLKFDYRSVYSALLQDFLGAGNNALNAALISSFPKPAIVSTAAKADVTCFSDIILPVRISELRATPENDGSVTVSWKTATETNTHYFEIERNDGNSNFVSIGRVNAAGNAAFAKNYSFSDKQPLAGLNLYRLKQVDRNGDFSYYGPVSVNLRKRIPTPELRIAPNPAITYFDIQLQMPASDQLVLRIFDIQGHLLKTEQHRLSRGANSIRINTGGTSLRGKLIVQLQTSGGFKHSQQVLVR
jgi:uncharacterized protein (DUF1501 family)